MIGVFSNQPWAMPLAVRFLACVVFFSTVVPMSLGQAPAVLQHPQNFVQREGALVAMRVSASGALPLAYVWFKDGVPLNDASGISGTRSAELRLSNVQEASNGRYFVVVSNSFGSITSSNALLTVSDAQGKVAAAFIANSGDDTVSVLARSTFAPLAVIPVGDGPLRVVSALDGKQVFVANQLEGTISVIDTATHNVTATIGVGSQPYWLEMARDGHRLFVVNSGSSNLSVIDIRSNAVIQTVAVGSNPSCAVYHPARDEVWVGYNRSSNLPGIEVLSAASFAPLASSPNGVFASSGLAFAPDGSQGIGAESCGGCGRFHRFSGNHSAGTITILQNNILSPPDGVAQWVTAHPSNGMAYLSKSSPAQSIHELTMSNGNVGRGLSLPSNPVGSLTDSLRNQLWVTCMGGSVVVVNLGSFTSIYTNQVGSVPTSIAFAPFDLSKGPARVLTPPLNTVASAGGNAQLGVIAIGQTPFFYQWFFENEQIPAATNELLNINNVQPIHAGAYFVVVSNSLGSATSQIAALTVETTFGAGPNGGSIIVRAYSASWGDFEDDGFIDLLTGGNAGGIVYRNPGGNAAFTLLPGGPATAFGSVSWGDYDNDGHLDFIGNGGGTQTNGWIYRNTGAGNFVRVNNAFDGPGPAGASGFAWGDYDRDGWIDLFTSNNLQPDEVYRNNRDGTFSRVTNAGINSYSSACAWGDFNNDGWLDLFMMDGEHKAFRSNGNGTFTEITNAGFVSGSFPVNCSLGDYDNDGYLDVLVADGLNAHNYLYRNNGSGAFTTITNGTLVERRGSFGQSTWGDYDNDGWLDLFVVGDTNALFRNNRDGTFALVTELAGLGGGFNCTAFGDFNGDGFLDLFMGNNLIGGSRLYRNNGNSNSWLTVRCVGQASNRGGIGVKVKASAIINGVPLTVSRTISGGEGRGGQNGLRAHLGLGDATNVDLLRIEWPSGVVQTLSNVAPRQRLTIVETAPPVIDLAPASQVAAVSSNVALSVLARGSAPLGIQWFRNGIAVPEATNATLTWSNLQPANAGYYSAVVSNPFGYVTTRVATLTVLLPSAPPAGLVGWWRGEDNATDTIGLNPGTLNNGTSFAAGVVGKAFRFDYAQSQYVLVPDSSSLRFTTNMTLEAWVRPDFTRVGAMAIFSKDGGGVGNDSYQTSLSSNSAALGFVAPGETWPGNLLGATLVFPPDSWTHLAWAYDGGWMRIYTNGALASSQNVGPKSIAERPVNLRISSDESNNGFYDGLIDEAAAWNRALSPEEILAHFQAGTGGYLATPPFIASGPQSHTVAASSNATFSINLSGSAASGVQWLHNGVLVPDATNAVFILTNAQPAQAGNYAAVVRNAFGSVTSQVAVLTVETAFVRQTASGVETAGNAGPGISAVDYDDDGDLDLLFVSVSANGGINLFRNSGDGSFIRNITNALVAETGAMEVGAWADFDNDGDLDVIITKTAGSASVFFRNDGNDVFTKSIVGINDNGFSYNATWADFDNDGFVDVFLSTAFLGNNDLLYRNNGNGTFTSMEGQPLVLDGASNTSAVWGDYDNDGDLDLFVPNNGFGSPAVSSLYRNNGRSQFSVVNAPAIAAMGTSHYSEAGAWGDYDNDGDADLLVVNNGGGPAFLFRNDNAGGGFTRVLGGSWSTDVPNSINCLWADYDNDGWLDMFLAGDAPSRLYRNNRDATFSRVTLGPLPNESTRATSAVWADLNDDGFLDVALVGPPNRIYQSVGNSNAWLQVKLVGTRSNRAAIGAKVRVRANVNGTNFWQLREISGGTGWGSQNLLAYFGLGNATNVDVLRVEWPSGIVQTFSNVASRQFLTIQEQTTLYFAVSGSGSVSYSPVKSNYFIGDLITLTATPRNPDWTRFLRWSDGNTNAMRNYTVALTNVLTAIFTNQPGAELEELVFKQWDKSFGGSSNDAVTAARPTIDGGYIIGGWSTSAPGGNKTATNYGAHDFWVIKLDDQGTKQWEKTFGGNEIDVLTSVSQTHDGGYLIGGVSTSGATGNKSTDGYGADDFWVLKLDAAGSKEWEKTFGGGGTDQLQTALQTEDHGIILGGYSSSPTTGNKTATNHGGADFWMIRLDPLGNKLWERTYGGTNDDFCFAVATVSDGGFILGGTSHSPASGNKTSPNFGNGDYWTVRLDANGNQLWDRSFGGDTNDALRSIAVTQDAGFLLGGTSLSGASGNKNSINAGGIGDYWVVRLDASGNKIDEFSAGGIGVDSLEDVTPASDGGFILGGYSDSPVGVNKTTPSQGGYDFWLVRLDASQSIRWDQSFGGSTNDSLDTVTLTSDGGFLLAGTSSSDPGGHKTAPAFGRADLWVVKSAIREAPVGTPAVLVNGLYSPTNFFAIPVTNTVSVTLTSTFPNGFIFYTLDGSEPDFSSTRYDGSPFTIEQAAIVWAIAYSHDGSQVQRADPVTISILPLYTLTDTTTAGGAINISPSSGPYLSNAVVTLTANPSNGWTFLRWGGDLVGMAENPLSLPIRRSLSVRAIFGTTLLTNVPGGGGGIAISPSQGPYAHGRSVRLTGVPAAGKYFSRWFNFASGPTNNPIDYLVLSNTPTVNAFFANLPANTFSLATPPNGAGTVARTPSAAYYPSNASVQITAVPDAGWAFINWSGDASSSVNPLTVVMNASKVVMPNFVPDSPLNDPPLVALTNPVSGAVFTQPVIVSLGADATDPEGQLTGVEFYAGPTLLGTSTNVPFTFAWTNPPVASHTLRAVAVDSVGARGTSAPVAITVNAPPNQPPLVSITNPTNGASFVTGTSIELTAIATDLDGSITSVEFFVGANSLGVDVAPPFTAVFDNVPAGVYSFTAQATDNFGATTVSAPLTVSVSTAGGAPAFRFEHPSYTVDESSALVTLRVTRNFAGFATVNFSTGDGSANAGADYVAAQGPLDFQGGETFETITVTIREDLVVEGDHTFTVTLSLPSANGVPIPDGLATPFVTTVTIRDNDAQSGDSFLSIVPPSAVDTSDLGNLRVYLTSDNGLGQWRLPWERSWRNSGTAAGGLQPGLYEIEFKPVSGHLPPAPATLAVNATAETLSTNAYTSLGSTPTGSLTVFIDPPAIAANIDAGCRGQWSILGQPFRDSGTTMTGLPAGSYAVTFKGLNDGCGWSTPLPREAIVRPGLSNSFRVSYVTNVSGLEPVVPLTFNSIQNSYANQEPFTFCGQITTEFGEGSGVVVKERVVLTAAHVVFDDYSLSWVGNARWFFQRHAPDYNPAPQEVRGYYVNGGYAAQRQAEGTPGISSPTSFDLDVAALYFYEAAGRGGYGGYLVSDVPVPQWLQTNSLKALIGYPVEGIVPVNVGRMHKVGPASLTFAQTTGAVFTCAQFRGLPGHSGSPLCVRFGGNGYYYPAGLHVGGSDKAVVRAIDRRAVDLINQAELTSNLGTNQTGGGVIRFGVTVPAGTCFDFATVTLTPPSAIAAGAQWRVHYKASGLSPWTNSSAYRVILNNKPDFLELRDVEGFLTPDAVNLDLGCRLTNLHFAYVQLLPRLDPIGPHLVLSGVTNRVYQVEYKSILDGGTNWTRLTNIAFPANNNAAIISNALPINTLPSGASDRFFRARRLP